MWLLFADSLFWFLHECLGGRVSLRHLLTSFGGLVHLTRIMDHCHLLSLYYFLQFLTHFYVSSGSFTTMEKIKMCDLSALLDQQYTRK